MQILKKIALTTFLLIPLCSYAKDKDIVVPDDSVIPNEYIVKIKRDLFKVDRGVRVGVEDTIKRITSELLDEIDSISSIGKDSGNEVSEIQNRIIRTYENVLLGFHAELSEDAVAKLRKSEYIERIEPNSVLQLAAIQTPTPSWGLDRIDQPDLPLNNSYDYDLDGTGVHAYVVDSGILHTHVEFTGRIGAGRDIIDNDNTPLDCDGHGTLVASILGGTIYGAAKNVTLHGVRVADCNGDLTVATIAAGLDWVEANAIQPAIVNMSLEQEVGDPMIIDSMNDLLDSGVPIVIAAGNSDIDACSGFGGVENAVTVGATKGNDSRSSYSNFGPCVDLFAPGGTNTAGASDHIPGAGIGSNSEIVDNFGTSFAAPFVAGVAALALEDNPNLSPAQLQAMLILGATENTVNNIGIGAGSPNLFINNQLFGSGSLPTDSMVPARAFMLLY